ncbi:MAG: metallophosphoesterase [Clostridia bacterium]|nr:metallophosphoesterase [Clostridia bacterium]
MIYVISDLHGYPHERFMRLLEEAGFSDRDFLYILGDVVDRNGDGGVETLRWLLYQDNVQLILGNHEAMLLSCSFVFDEIREDLEETLTAEKIGILQTYGTKGGDVTLKAMRKLNEEDRQDILDYLKDCSLYEELSVGGKRFILVHSGLGNFSEDKDLEDYTIEELIWTWPKITDEYYRDAMTVFGHTPTMAFGEDYRDSIVRTATWMDIDMGAGFGREPVLLRLDDMKEFRLTQEI